mgnify:CR=1 FL=1
MKYSLKKILILGTLGIIFLLVLIYFITIYLKFKKSFPLTVPNLPPPRDVSPSSWPIQPKVEVKTEFPISQLLETNQPLLFSGIIKNLEDNILTLDIIWYDPIQAKFQSTETKITINPQDEILAYYKDKEDRLEKKTLKLSDLKVGDYLIISSKENKKTISVVFSLP